MRCRCRCLDLCLVRRTWPGAVTCRHFSRERLLQPLLPDYLNTGDSSRSEAESLKEPKVKEPKEKLKEVEPAEAPAPMEEPSVASTAKEKQLVAAFFQPAEAVSPLKRLVEPRRPLPSSLASMRSIEVVKILNKLSEDRIPHQPKVDTADDVEEVAVGEPTPPQTMSPTRDVTRDWDYRHLRLQVEPRHRHLIQGMMCKKILRDCLLTLRELQGQGQSDEPLWQFEGRRAHRLASQSVSLELIRFLAFKHLHIAHGPLRQTLIPGPILTHGQMTDLVAEWRQLMPWFRQCVGPVSEELLLRKFLDGELSWQLILELMRVDDKVRR
eukprot:Skav213547  [mRNA]  locus=scaffold263:8115:9089:+ [translate_table: standard]